MNATLNRDILKLALPSILANVTIPFVGMVGTAIAGHLPQEGGIGAATFIGAISVGAMLFNLLYWNFGFLRAGTGGLTAQAFGRGDMRECARLLYRAGSLALIIAGATLLLQLPFVKLALFLVKASPEVEGLALKYFLVRVWAAPATISLMAFSGWFVGMQDSMSSMWKDLIVNLVNVGAGYVLSIGACGFKGLGFIGLPLGTVIAQYCGLVFCILVCIFKYRRKVFGTFRSSDFRSVLERKDIGAFFKLNADLFVRSLCMTGIYIGYTMIAAQFGDLMLACSSIMMQLLMLFSYFTDGFAYAGEALAGRFIGARDGVMLKKTVRYIFVWSMSIAVFFMAVYSVSGRPLLRLLTSDASVVENCRQFLPWLVLMPPLGCAAFTWDGIYLGATASKAVRNAMLGATSLFLIQWFASKYIIQPTGGLAIHCLIAAYFTHLIFRTVYLSAKYRGSVKITEE